MLRVCQGRRAHGHMRKHPRTSFGPRVLLLSLWAKPGTGKGPKEARLEVAKVSGAPARGRLQVHQLGYVFKNIYIYIDLFIYLFIGMCLVLGPQKWILGFLLICFEPTLQRVPTQKTCTLTCACWVCHFLPRRCRKILSLS